MCHFPKDNCKICSLKDVCQTSKNSQCFEACKSCCNGCELGQEHCSNYVEEKFSNMIPPSFLCSPSKLSNTHRSASKCSCSSEKRRAAAKKQEGCRKDAATTQGHCCSVAAAMQEYCYGTHPQTLLPGMQGAYGPLGSYDYWQDARQACTNTTCEFKANASEAATAYYNAWSGHTNGQVTEIKNQPVTSHIPAAGLPSQRLPSFNPCTGEEYKEAIDPLRYIQCPLYAPPAEPSCFDACFYAKPPIYEPSRMQEICPCQPKPHAANKLSTVRFCEASQTPSTFCCNGKAGRHCCPVGSMSGQKQKRDVVKPTSKSPDVRARSRSLSRESRPKISEPKVKKIKSSPAIVPMEDSKTEEAPKEIKTNNSGTQNTVETRSCGCNANLGLDDVQNADQENATTSEPMCQRCTSPCCYMCGNCYSYPCCANYCYNYCNPYYWPYCFGCYCYNSCCQSCPMPQPATPMTPKTQSGATTNKNDAHRESLKSTNSVENKTKKTNPRMQAGTMLPFNHNSQSLNCMSRPWAAHQQFSNFNMNSNPHMCHSTFCSYGPQQQAASCPISMSPQQRRLRPQ